MDENQSKIMCESAKVLHLEEQIKRADKMLGTKTIFPLPESRTYKEIRTKFREEYDPSAEGFLANINRSVAVSNAMEQIKKAELACYRVLNIKTTQLIQKQQEVLRQMALFVADLNSKNQGMRMNVLELTQKNRELTEVITAIKNQRKGG